MEKNPENLEDDKEKNSESGEEGDNCDGIKKIMQWLLHLKKGSLEKEVK
ncbi:MAG: hypothetical protein ABH881_04475 [bacterium]